MTLFSSPKPMCSYCEASAVSVFLVRVPGAAEQRRYVCMIHVKQEDQLRFSLKDLFGHDVRISKHPATPLI